MNRLFASPHRDLAAGVLVLVALICLFHVVTAWHGEGRYRDQHIGVALHYADTHIGLKETIIPGFNATDTPTIQELPIWQAVAGLAFKVLGRWWGWGNIVSLVLFLNCLYPLFRVAQMYSGDRVAWWSLILFLSQALIFAYAGEAGTDGFCLSVSIWFWFACCQLLENPVPWIIPAAALGTLTAVSKMPFFMAVGLASFLLLLKVKGFKWPSLAALAAVGVVSGVCFLLWTHYTDAVLKKAEFPFTGLQASDPPMVFWYFGDWHYRLNPGNWIKAAWRLANVTFGNFTLIPLFFYALVGRWGNDAAKCFLAGSFLTTLVFSHLILHHYNYLMLYSPVVAILCACAFNQVDTFLAGHGIPRITIVSLAGVVLFLSLFQGLMTMRVFSFDHFPARMATIIAGQTTPQDKLMIINGGWGGDELIRTHRRGLSIWTADIFENSTNYARLKELGFNKLVILGESPYQNAVVIVNPGQTDIPRDMAKSYLTPRIEKWHTVYATDDIIIKDIP